MRVLHTADWHLGQHFLTGQERLTEQRAFLNWLLAAVRDQGVEALVVAGDVFDTTTSLARGAGAVLYLSGAAARHRLPRRGDGGRQPRLAHPAQRLAAAAAAAAHPRGRRRAGRPSRADCQS
ncbi:MAG: metallophosphoesterase [Hymenobacter sp.]